MSWREDYGDADGGQSDDERASTSNASTYLLIAVDSDLQMFEGQFEGKSLFKAVLLTCYRLLDAQLLKGGPRGGNRLGIVVASEDGDAATICNFKDNLPAVLKQLRAVCDRPDEELKRAYRRDAPFDIAEFLLSARAKFKEVPAGDARCVVYVANDDDPVRGDDGLTFKAANQARALADANVRFELVTFREEFAYGAFFKELLYSCNCKFNYEYLTDTISLEDRLLSLLTLRGKKMRFYVFPANKNAHFEVLEKTYVKPSKSINNVKVRRGDLKEVKAIRVKESVTGEYRVKYTKTDSLNLTEEEKNVFVNDGVALGFTLIGTSAGLLEPGMHCTNPKFIQENKRAPNPLFDALWGYCAEKNRTLVCARKYRAGTAPTVVELAPRVVNNVRSLLVLGVPFREDVREQPLHGPLHEQPPTEDDALMEAAEQLVTALDFDYDPLKVHNTVHCRRAEYIRSQLLEEPARPVADVCDFRAVEGSDVDEAVKGFGKLIRLSVKRKRAKK